MKKLFIILFLSVVFVLPVYSFELSFNVRIVDMDYLRNIKINDFSQLKLIKLSRDKIIYENNSVINLSEEEYFRKFLSIRALGNLAINFRLLETFG
ncbi:MAG: hypothetical protein ACD_79C00922G0002 [uncultured bacterium]|nr:MAG: hypothetical protein ACD_79C00922G0002 [uncultured bacterium]